MEKDFILNQISWITLVERNYNFDPALVYNSFWGFVNFVQINGLTTHTFYKSRDELNEESNIKKSDLTEEG